MEHDKILKRGVLMQKTIYQINPQFTPTISAIEAAIDTMIHKKYLERQSDGRLGKS
jgi:hypothetical protein